MKILWAGPYFNERAFTAKRALNIASTVWSHGFVRGLRANGADVTVATLCPEQAWPNGKVFWQNNDPGLFDHDVPVHTIPYLNVAYLREAWQSVFFARMVKRILASERFDAFVCYNVLHPYHVAAMKVAKRMGVKVCPIVLDSGYDPIEEGFAKMLHQARYADELVFLSQWTAENFPANGRRILQMEGGVADWLGNEPSAKRLGEPFVVTYAGAWSGHRGQGLAEMIRCCQRKDVHFIICGKWNMNAAKEAMGHDARVELRGMVSDAELRRIYSKTDVFVNSRAAAYGHNLVNFPSKLSAYIAYGRPVVSNWVESFPQDYRELLCVSDDDSGAAMARKLDEVLDWDIEQRIACCRNLHKAYNESKSWTMQAKKFLDFISSSH